jgi:hypothetical protein
MRIAELPLAQSVFPLVLGVVSNSFHDLPIRNFPNHRSVEWSAPRVAEKSVSAIWSAFKAAPFNN